ncbi:MAG: DUF2800 domain-containing protein [Eubacteriales bacterium]|nr:DUF2800 domain-containing protein [Eubacteriales bacterium]
MAKHALLSASSAHRWLNCPPSARLTESYEDKGSDYAAQGTDAHALCEYRLKQLLGIAAQDPTENMTWYDEEMEGCANDYTSYIADLITEAKTHCKDPVVLIEQRLDYSRYVESGYGTGDCLVIADDTLNVIDLKYGKGVEVEAAQNPQMMLYALGALELFDDLYDINAVTMTIFQPRRANVSIWTITKSDLYQWAENTLRPAAELAFKGEGKYHSGDWCQFCKAKQGCRARADEQMALMRYDFQMPPLLTDEDVEDILGRVDQLVSWAEDIKEYALQSALSGKQWPGWKLVEGRSNRRYVDETAVADAVAAVGLDPFEHKLRGITSMTSLLGRKQFDEMLGSLIEKPQGKPTLAPESDKRPAMNTNDFKDEGE